jgi:HPt (histidine-containing phosphotransfer) domain-containing protein
MDDGGLYKELLETFRRENTGVISELQAALDAGDMRKTSIILHTLKGVAGNLSAEILRGYAEQFEKVISAGLITCMDEAEPYLSRLKKAYAEACDSADAFVRIYGAVVPEPQGSVSQQPLPDDQISPALEKMRHLLLDHSFEADAMAEFLKDALKHTECSEEACVLSEHVGKYDFLGGLEVLNTIKGKLNIR